MTTEAHKKAVAKYQRSEKGRAAEARAQKKWDERHHKTQRINGVWVVRESHKQIEEGNHVVL